MKDHQSIREQFPILDQKVHTDTQLVYLDNAASVQKPLRVIERINQYYRSENANIHRGVHFLSDLSTNNYESSRNKVQNLINASYNHEVIFTKGTTDSINLVASSLRFSGKIKKGDNVVISYMEHHSNIVPWQMLCEATQAQLRVIPIDENAELILDDIHKIIDEKTKIVSVNHISNSLGTVNPIETLIKRAKEVGSKTLIDAAQSIQHMPIDVQELGCDFLVFSGHKMYGPTGIGILYGKENILDELPPYQGGGDMIDNVTFKKTTYNSLPHKFEAGTPNIVGGVALGEAIDFLNDTDLEKINNYENDLLEYTFNQVKTIDGLKIVGTPKKRSGVISFIVDKVHPFDLGTLLDNYGVAIRTGHHCTQPVMDFFKIPGTCRASIAVYNNKNDIDYFIDKMNKCLKMLR